MKKFLSFIFILFLVSSLFAQEPDAFNLLEKSSSIMACRGDYSATLSLIVEKPGKPKENLQYKVFERTDKGLLTLVKIFPEADKGSGYLKNEDNFWYYDQTSRKFTHTSIKESLDDSDVRLDDMSQRDKKWSTNYEVTGFEEGQLGKFPVYVISLAAKNHEPAYAKSVFYLRKDNAPLLLKREDYSASARLMRTTLIPKYAKVSSGFVAVQVILKDELNKGENTQQIISDLSFEKLPDYIFTKAYLEGLN